MSEFEAIISFQILKFKSALSTTKARQLAQQYCDSTEWVSEHVLVTYDRAAEWRSDVIHAASVRLQDWSSDQSIRFQPLYNRNRLVPM